MFYPLIINRILLGRELDEYRLIDQIPHNFHKLVELKGVQIAFEVFLQCIFGIQQQ